MLINVFKKHPHDKVTVSKMIDPVIADCGHEVGDCNSVRLEILEEVDCLGCGKRSSVHYRANFCHTR